jgi:hypothetical protein
LREPHSFCPRLQPDGTLLVPMRAEGPGGIVGDGAVTIRPEHPDYVRYLEDACTEEEWRRWVSR